MQKGWEIIAGEDFLSSVAWEKKAGRQEVPLRGRKKKKKSEEQNAKAGGTEQKKTAGSC